MGLFLKIFIPLLGLVLAFYFYSAPENFNEGKSLEKACFKTTTRRLLPEQQRVPMHGPFEGPFKMQLKAKIWEG